MKGYRVYSKIQQFRSAGFSQRQVARRLGINRKTVKRYWEMPVDEYEEMLPVHGRDAGGAGIRPGQHCMRK